MDIDGPCTCDIDGEDGVGGQAEVVEEGAEVHLGQAGGQHLHRHHHLTHNCWNKYQLSGGAVLGSWIRTLSPDPELFVPDLDPVGSRTLSRIWKYLNTKIYF